MAAYNIQLKKKTSSSSDNCYVKTQWSAIDNKPSWIGSSKPSYVWSEIGSKPSTFPPSSHTHSISEITNLQDGLDEIASIVTKVPLLYDSGASITSSILYYIPVLCFPDGYNATYSSETTNVICEFFATSNSSYIGGSACLRAYIRPKRFGGGAFYIGFTNFNMTQVENFFVDDYDFFIYYITGYPDNISGVIEHRSISGLVEKRIFTGNLLYLISEYNIDVSLRWISYINA